MGKYIVSLLSLAQISNFVQSFDYLNLQTQESSRRLVTFRFRMVLSLYSMQKLRAEIRLAAHAIKQDDLLKFSFQQLSVVRIRAQIKPVRNRKSAVSNMLIQRDVAFVV